MKDALAFFIIFFGVIFLFIIADANPPESELGKTICANMTCYYEIKDK
jgi:hypothetical protein